MSPTDSERLATIEQQLKGLRDLFELRVCATEYRVSVIEKDFDKLVNRIWWIIGLTVPLASVIATVIGLFIGR